MQSGDSVARYCREQGISECQLSYWRKKLGELAVVKPVGFSKLCAAPAEASPCRIRVRMTEFELSSVEDLRTFFGSRA